MADPTVPLFSVFAHFRWVLPFYFSPLVLLLCLSSVVHDSCQHWFYNSSDHFCLYFLWDFFLIKNDVFITLYSFLISAILSLISSSEVPRLLMISPRYLNMPICSMSCPSICILCVKFSLLIMIVFVFPSYIWGLFLLDVRLLYLHFLVGFPQYFQISPYPPLSHLNLLHLSESYVVWFQLFLTFFNHFI